MFAQTKKKGADLKAPSPAGTELDECRPARPRDKGPAESLVNQTCRYYYSRTCRDTFFSYDELNGTTGCGKSFLACAIGINGIQERGYFSMNRFIGRIALDKLDGSLLKIINHIEKNDLVIFDDFVLRPLDNNSRLALLRILEDRYQRKSVIVPSIRNNLNFAEPNATMSEVVHLKTLQGVHSM